MGLGAIVCSPRLHERHPGIGLSLVIAMLVAAPAYMIFLKVWLSRKVFSDRSMSVLTRNLLFVVPAALLGPVGLILGLLLESLMF